MKKSKALALTCIISSLFFGVLAAIAKTRHGSLDIMAYCFAVLGIIYFILVLYQWIAYTPDERRQIR